MGQILSQPITEKHSINAEDKFVSYGLSCMQGWRMNMEDAHSTILDMYKIKNYDPEEIDMDDDEKPKDADSDDNNDSNDEEEEGEEKKDKKNANKSGSESEANGIAPTDDGYEHVSFFGVYDGHGGEKAAIFTGDYLHRIIKSTDSFKRKDYANALKEGFLNCDQAILRDFHMRDDDSGCAATSVLVTPNTIYCGNAGDSRTVMSINGFAKALSYDHKPSNEGEKTRICSAGGYVEMGRVNGNLALSRGIGDFEFKKNIDLPAEEQIVTCYPDVIQHTIDFDSDEFIILACDGIWDCLTSQNCVECVRRGIFERKSFTSICEEIMELCCAPTSDGSGIGCDNMSISIVALLDYRKNETLDQWYDRVIEKIKINQSEDSGKDANKYGPISQPYKEIYKEIYGPYYEIGQQASGSNSRNNAGGLGGAGAGAGGLGGYSMFGGLPGLRTAPGEDEFDEHDEDDVNNNHDQADNDDDDDKEGEDPEANVNGAISLQKLLASNAITNENGVIYLDTSSAQSLLAHLGMPGSEDVNFEDVEDVHDKHIEEDVDEEEEGDEQDGSNSSQPGPSESSDTSKAS